MNRYVYEMAKGKSVFVQLDPNRHGPQSSQVQGRLLDRIETETDAMWIVEGKLTAFDQNKRPVQQKDIQVFVYESDIVQIMIENDHAGLTVPRIVG